MRNFVISHRVQDGRTISHYTRVVRDQTQHVPHPISRSSVADDAVLFRKPVNNPTALRVEPIANECIVAMSPFVQSKGF